MRGSGSDSICPTAERESSWESRGVSRALGILHFSVMLDFHVVIMMVRRSSQLYSKLSGCGEIYWLGTPGTSNGVLQGSPKQRGECCRAVVVV